MNRNNGRKIAERLIPLRNYLIANADRTHPVRIEDIQTYYFNIGITGKDGEPLNIKTIYRDLHAFLDRENPYDIVIGYEEKLKGWVLYNPPFEPYELRLIVDSVQASKFITQQEARKLTEKIKQNFGSGRRYNLNRQAYVYDRIRSKNDSVVKETDRIHQAISEDKRIAFRYFRVDRMEHISEPRSEPREGKDLFSAKNLTNQKAKVFRCMRARNTM